MRQMCVVAAIDQLKVKGVASQLALLTPSSWPQSPLLSPIAKLATASSTPPPPSSARTQVMQLLFLNDAVRAEIGETDREIRMLQRAIVLLSTSDWVRGEWVWFTRLAGFRTLWDVWCWVSRQHRKDIAAAAASVAATTTNRQGNGRSGSANADEMHVDDVRTAPAPSLWSALTGARGIGVDSTNTANAETRRAAAAAHDEDWFINLANKFFEL
uniref:Uncharacterized protein n=1 Tax=Haptolina brevifila TaxID=156173 RepID=A0A7S2DN18_9EUKA|mmetsp:Transcript_41199/g.82545  ORF Transcript_41199/g.82545 Transcript_41199/m.82545 type:complete len:214 (+) Transcript_41199:54-695(+)